MSDVEIWAIIAGLAGVTFLIRWSFLGLLGGQMLPGWARMALGFVPVTVLPALVAPVVLFSPEAGWASLPVMAGAAATVAVGMLTRHLFGAFGTGVLVYHMAVAAGL
ncbi:MAG: AzlD domain-containing protein [Paracoccaceae bacterium]